MRGIIKNYKEAKVEDEKLEELPRKERGSKPLRPSELDENILLMIKNMRQADCTVKYNIAITISKGILLANDFSLL